MSEFEDRQGQLGELSDDISQERGDLKDYSKDATFSPKGLPRSSTKVTMTGQNVPAETGLIQSVFGVIPTNAWNITLQTVGTGNPYEEDNFVPVFDG